MIRNKKFSCCAAPAVSLMTCVLLMLSMRELQRVKMLSMRELQRVKMLSMRELQRVKMLACVARLYFACVHRAVVEL